jgi:hypothetical protein
MKQNAWQKVTPKEATFERFEKMLRGMSGYGASRASITRKRHIVTTPKINRHRTVAEAHG